MRSLSIYYFLTEKCFFHLLNISIELIHLLCFSETSRTESANLSSGMMKAHSDPLQQAEQDNSLGRATSHISRSELRSSSSGAMRNVGVSSLKGTSSGLPETQRKSVGEMSIYYFVGN